MTPVDASYQAGRFLMDHYGLKTILFYTFGTSRPTHHPVTMPLAIRAALIRTRAETIYRITGASLN